jgi:hypothetical protein
MDTTFKSFTDRVATITPTVLCYRLLPFSLGHSLNLKAVKSKFITGEYNSFCDINHIAEKLITDKDLIAEFVVALLVCSNTYDDFKEEIGNGLIVNTIKELVKDIENNKYNLLFSIHTFANYLKDGTNAPLYELTGDSQNNITSTPVDTEEAIVSTLMENTNYTRNECWNLPLTETLSAYLLYAHKVGSVELISKEICDLKASMKGNK